MKHHLRIDEPDQSTRWLYYNQRQSHPLNLDLLAEIQALALGDLWCQDPHQGALLGQKLFRLLNGTGGLLLQLAREPAALYLQLPSDLSNLPFEIMWEGGGFFCLTRQLPIFRHVPPSVPLSAKNPEPRPLRLLFMACSPEDTESVLDFEAEEECIVKQLEDQKLPVEFQVEDSGSLEGLKFQIREFQPFDILHLSGHAGLGGREPLFLMETDTGFRDEVNPQRLWASLRNQQPQQLFLSGCETAKAGRGAAGSFAEQMVRLGLPFAIGWGLSVDDWGSKLLAQKLYHGLGFGLSLELAVVQALQDLQALEQLYGTWCWLRVYSDGSPQQAFVQPPNRVIHRPPRKQRYHMLQESQVKVLEYGFVGRRRQVQLGTRVLKADLPDKNGLLITGAAGVGKSTLTGKLVERFPKHEVVVFPGEISAIGILSKLEQLFERHGHKAALALLTSQEPLGERIKELLRGPLRELPTLLIFDDFEQNLEAHGDVFELKHDKPELLLPFLQALALAEGKSQLIITSRYPFGLRHGGVEWLDRSLLRIPLMGLRGADLDKKIRNLDRLQTSPHLQSFREFCGGNPRLLEWFDALAEANALPSIVQLEAALQQKRETYIESYLAEILVATQEPPFRQFLAAASVYRKPVEASAFELLGGPAFLQKAVDLTLMEQEGTNKPVYWVLPQIRHRYADQVEDPQAVHQIARDWYAARLDQAGTFQYSDADECLYHADLAKNMDGCWGHAANLGTYFLKGALFREGVARLYPLEAHLRHKPETAFHSDEVAFLNELAQLLDEINRRSEAELLMRRILDIDKAAFGPNPPNFTTHLNNLAALLAETSQLVESEKLYRQALAIDQAAFGPDHPNVAFGYNNLANLLKDTDPKQAENLFRQALAIFENALGSNNREVPSTRINLANLLRKTNRMAEAESLCRDALAIDENILVSDHPNIVRDLNSLAGVLKSTNRVEEAEPLYFHTLTILRSFYGPNHPDVATVLGNLATLYHDTNRLTEAENYAIHALVIFMKSVPQNPHKVKIALSNLWHIATKLGRSKEEVTRLLEAALAEIPAQDAQA